MNISRLARWGVPVALVFGAAGPVMAATPVTVPPPGWAEVWDRMDLTAVRLRLSQILAVGREVQTRAVPGARATPPPPVVSVLPVPPDSAARAAGAMVMAEAEEVVAGLAAAEEGR